MRRTALLFVAPVLFAALAVLDAAQHSPVTISILSTTDVHGFVFPRDGHGGIAAFGGYVKNVRAARAADGGGVLLVDAGDTFQGGIESDLSEGALVVDAYNALGYTAAAIGNHEFEFGPVDLAGARQSDGDPRGALKARAAQAAYPVLAGNLIDDTTGRSVDWPNVRRSIVVETAGVRVGLIGVMTIEALRATMPVNVHGLHVAPLAGTIETEAQALRSNGAKVVIVVAHAGGGCTSFVDPLDLSSCDRTSEIFEVARSLPRGLVDVIAAGHTHDGLAHIVNGIALVQGYALGRAFSRADVMFDKRTSRVVGAKVFAPRDVCPGFDAEAGICSANSPHPASNTGSAAETYEGRAVVPDARVASAMAPALDRVRELRSTELGVVLDRPVARVGDRESSLGNLFADALRQSIPGADVALNNNTRGGLRADLPKGRLTFGSLYDVFPFDNRLASFTLSGAEMRRVVTDEIGRNRPGAIGISGIRVLADCGSGSLNVSLIRSSGRPVADNEQLGVVAMDSLVSGPMFSSVVRDVPVTLQSPVLREVVEGWLRGHRGVLNADRFSDSAHSRWEISDQARSGCGSR